MESELRAIFHTGIQCFGAAQSLSVQYPNYAFTLPTAADAKYLSIYELPTSPSVHSVCGESRFRWILQVSIVVRDGLGEVMPLEYADKIRDDVFPVNSELEGGAHRFVVLTPPTPAPPVQLEGWFSIPVRFTVQTIQ